ncbi:MAG: O-antigen ligase family protein [Myxococcota bacterium]
MARVATIGCVFFLVLAVGGAHPSVNAAGALILAVIAGVLFGLAPHRQHISLGPPFYLVSLAAGATLFQLIPWPAPLVRLISPIAATVHETAVDEPSWFIPLTLDLPATQHELLKLVILVLGGLVSAELFIRRPKDLFGGIALAGIAVFLVGIVHQLAGWKTTYGVFPYAPPFPTSFINPNHAAAFMGFSSMLALGLALSVRDRSRFLWAGCSILCATGLILTLSRGGILAFGATLLFATALLFARERLNPKSLLALQVGGAASLLIAAYLAYSEIVHEMWTLGDETAVSKAAIWTALPTLVRDYWAFGVGRGALGMVYPAHQTIDVPKTFTHLENEWLQPFVDWGLPLGAALIGLVLWTAVLAFRRLDDDPLRIAGAAALMFLAVHNLADFNLALTGVSLPAVLVATVLVATPHRSRRRRRGSSGSSTRLHRRAAVAVAAAALPLTLLLAPTAVTHRIERDTARIRGQVGTGEFAEGTVRRHPADFVLPLLAAVHTLRETGQEQVALRWLNRSMLRAPLEPMPHRIAARALWRLGAREQAMLELRLANGLGAQTNTVVAEALELTSDVQWLTALIGDSAERRLAVSRALLGERNDESALAVADHETTRETADFFVIQATVAERRKDYEGMIAAAHALRTKNPRDRESYVIEGRALLALRDAPDAVRMLELGVETVGPNAALMRMFVSALTRAGDYSRAKEIAKTLIGRTSRPNDAGAAHALLGQVYLAEGQTQRALLEFEKARDRQPTNRGLYLRIAQLREQLGNTRGALAELTRLEAVDPGNPAGQRMRERIEAEVERVKREREVQTQQERLDALLSP